VDDNINVDKNDKTEDIKKAVRSENIEEISAGSLLPRL
jgi:hypothetical protein